MQKKNKIIISVIVIAILFGTYIIFDRNQKNPGQLGNSIDLNNIDLNQLTATSTGGTIHVGPEGSGYTIEQVPLENSVPKPIPDLNRPVHPAGSAQVSPEAISRATSEILSLQVALKKNPASFDSWLSLAMYQKMAGDYQGAAISLEYASKLAPSDFISLGNLGNLYAYFLRDNARAEMYYKQAISKGPAQVNLYTQLAEIYRDFFDDKTKALAIINQGLSKVPNDSSLLQFKATLQ
jgi:hypothetical protein